MTGGETQESSLPYGHGDPYNELWKVLQHKHSCHLRASRQKE